VAVAIRSKTQHGSNLLLVRYVPPPTHLKPHPNRTDQDPTN